MSALFSEVGLLKGRGWVLFTLESPEESDWWQPNVAGMKEVPRCDLWWSQKGLSRDPSVPKVSFAPGSLESGPRQKESFSIRWWLQGSRSTGQPFSGTQLVVREWEVTCRVRRARARGDQGRKTRVFLVLGTVSASGPPEAWMSSGPSAFPECLSRFFISKVSQRYVFIFFLQSNRIIAIFTFFTRDKSDLFNKHKASFYIFNNHSKSDSHSTCPLISFWVHFLFKWALLCSLWLKSWGWSIFSN